MEIKADLYMASVNSIVLLAKQSGLTSFSSLWQIKDALNTKKIGHTGTLDNFADGLLVVLSGSLTRLCPYVMDFDKEYLARFEFGTETDTLDPEGNVILTKELPRYQALLVILPQFVGTIKQKPPAFSALHVNGQRASDLARSGESIHLDSRNISLYAIDVLDAKNQTGDFPQGQELVSSIDVRISCSKGTYIRALARDIAYAVNSCAFVSALRRTRIGPFLLDDAAGVELLPAFGTHPFVSKDKAKKIPRVDPAKIMSSALAFTPEFALRMNLIPLFLKDEFVNDFFKGKRLSFNWFIDFPNPLIQGTAFFIFNNSYFCGSVLYTKTYLKYLFVTGVPN